MDKTDRVKIMGRIMGKIYRQEIFQEMEIIHEILQIIEIEILEGGIQKIVGHRFYQMKIIGIIGKILIITKTGR